MTALRSNLLLLSLLFLFATSVKGHAQPVLTGSSLGETFQVTKISEGLGIPWGMTLVAPDSLLITQLFGTAVLLDLNSGEKSAITGLPEVEAKGQGGLLDVIAQPGYQSQTGWLYFTYSKAAGQQSVTTLARAQLRGTSLLNWQDLLVTRSATTTSRHYGSRIAFDGQGRLFFSVGDRGERPNGQDLTTHAGTIMRLNLDGSVPKDNPFVGQANVLPEIWSYGHRNPQGLAFDQQNTRLWAIEHGPRGGDELNLIEKGLNYGWPITSHGKEYWGPIAVGEAKEKPGIEPPRKVYTPSIAPGSLLLYSGLAFPKWQGSLFAGALKLQHINHLAIDPQGSVLSETRLVEGLNERIRALMQSPKGFIYFSTDHGNLYRIEPIQ